eukprot:m.94373 g.94373  ORF g.94373 m.94373 type:complete len:215 (+) comp18373_c0_seq2:69-713(+)
MLLALLQSALPAFSVIVMSEIGDRTFFMVAIMAMRSRRSEVFAGALASAVVMTLLSAYVGKAAQFIPHSVVRLAAAGFFLFFGASMLREGWGMDADEANEELEEAELEVNKRTESSDAKPVGAGPWLPPVFTLVFAMTFFAEWGDRSQVATVVLGARQDLLGVMLGGVAGHALCNAAAVLGGKLVAERISLRSVTMCGGILFCLFALTGLLVDD